MGCCCMIRIIFHIFCKVQNLEHAFTFSVWQACILGTVQVWGQYRRAGLPAAAWQHSRYWVSINPYLKNGFSHHYQLGESTFIFRGVRSDFYFLSHFFDEISLCKQNSPRWDDALRRPIWGYAVCLCPTKKDARPK